MSSEFLPLWPNIRISGTPFFFAGSERCFDSLENKSRFKIEERKIKVKIIWRVELYYSLRLWTTILTVSFFAKCSQRSRKVPKLIETILYLINRYNWSYYNVISVKVLNLPKKKKKWKWNGNTNHKHNLEMAYYHK